MIGTVVTREIVVVVFGIVVVAPGIVVVVVVAPGIVVVVVAPGIVVVVPGGMLLKKLLVIVAVQVTVLAPPVPEPLHWLIVVGSPVDCEGGAVTVQVSVPPGPPELLHWVTLWPPGPPLPARLLPGGVAVQPGVLPVSGFWHCRTVESIAAPIG
ncbi:MAG: hypothetical protein ACYC1D_09735 [Acidimicrobiales bacterium]